MFEVIVKYELSMFEFERFTVYNTRDDDNGYPLFLIYNYGQWMWKSAKHFYPAEQKYMED